MCLRWFTVLCCFGTAALAFGQVGKVAIPARDLPFTPPRKWAMVIGASEYTELGRLRYADKDARAFAKVLQDRFEFSPTAVEVLTDSADSPVKPTVENVKKALDRQLADPRLNDGDLFIFYFSGHGIGTSTGDYLMPTNATLAQTEQMGLNVKDVVQRFVKAGLRNVLFIVDACRGGDKNPFGDDLRRLGREANVAVLLGCEPGARSYEYRQLGHGAFTNFLMKAMTDPELTSETTGSLWASRVGDDVREKVRAYTVRDYPDKPQSPTGWTERTMDVLLGVFPTKGATRLKLADIIKETERLDKETYLDSMRRFALDYFSEDAFAPAVEIWRTIDPIHKLDSMERFNLAMALSFMGKTHEMDNEFAKISPRDPNDLFAQLAQLYNPSRTVKPTDRVAAAKRIWTLSHAEWAGQIIWAVLQMYASDADANDFLIEYLKSPDISPRFRLLFEGYVLANKGDWRGAAEKWAAVRIVPGDELPESTLDAAEFQALVYQGKYDEIEPFLQRALKGPSGGSAAWHLLLAELYREKKDTAAMIAAVQSALDRKVEPSDLLWAVRLAGLRLPIIAEKVAKRADEFPYAWKAMVAKVFAAKLTSGQQAIAEALEAASKFCDDEFAVVYECFRFLDVALEQAVDEGKITEFDYSQFMLTYSSFMAQKIEQFGYDAEAWILFNKMSLIAEKFEQLGMLYNMFLGPRLKDKTLDPSLKAPYLHVALQIDDEPRVSELWRAGGFPFNEIVDGGWMVSMYYAVRGDIARAKAEMPREPASEPIYGIMEGYRAYLDVVEGSKKPDLDGLAKRYESSFGGMQWIALAYAHQKDWAKAMPIFEKNVMQRQLGFFFLQARAAEVYFNRLLENRQFDKANSLAHSIAISGYGNPIYRKIHFGPVAAVSSFAGKIELDAVEFEILPEMSRGTLRLEIAGDGKVKGETKLGDAKRSIDGRIDAYGNLVATISEGGTSWRMTGKIAQPKLYDTMEEFKRSSQAFLLLDAKGQSRYLLGRCKSGAGSVPAPRLIVNLRARLASR